MPLMPPVLDDRKFEDLVREVRSRIPRYTPEWTDHNETDPGITLVQLFAWLAEMLLFRFNRVPDLHYIKFLQLLGIELRPKTPAQVDLTFTLQKDEDFTVVPARAKVGVVGSEPPIVFEVLESFTALGGTLESVQVYDGVTFTSATTANRMRGGTFFPFGRFPVEGSALYLGFQVPKGFPAQEVTLMFYMKESPPGGLTLRCGVETIDIAPPADLVWEYRTSSGWYPLSLQRDDTRAFTKDGQIRFLGPGDPNFVRSILSGLTPAVALHWVRCRLARGQYEVPPEIDEILLNTVRAESAQTVRDEIVGGSDGTAGQVFTLLNAPVLPGSLELEVDEGQGFEPWDEVPDLFSSKPDQRHFILNRATGEIRFGRTRIPRAGEANIKATQYRYGGGAAANVGEQKVTDLQTFIRGVESVTNQRPAVGGADEETVEEAKLRTPSVLQSKERAVTASDFEQLAKEAPGARIRRAKALPMRHPDFPDVSVPGSVTVIVVPDWPMEAPGPPAPTAATLVNVCRHLERHRLLTTEVHVVSPTYVRLEVELPVFVQRTTDANQVRLEVEKTLTEFFHPLTGVEGTGWPFGRDIFFSDFYRVVLKVPGVERVDAPVLTVNGVRQPQHQNIKIPEGALVDLRKPLDIRIRYSEAT